MSHMPNSSKPDLATPVGYVDTLDLCARLGITTRALQKRRKRFGVQTYMSPYDQRKRLIKVDDVEKLAGLIPIES